MSAPIFATLRSFRLVSRSGAALVRRSVARFVALEGLGKPNSFGFACAPGYSATYFSR